MVVRGGGWMVVYGGGWVALIGIICEQYKIGEARINDCEGIEMALAFKDSQCFNH